MRVTVYFLAQLRQAAGTAAETVELPGACSPAALFAALAERHGEPLRRMLLDESGRPRPTVLVFVNDLQVSAADGTAVNDGDVVTLLSPIAGG